jgi:hypothetical protein
MSADFERQKNIKASAYTFGIAGALLLLFILVKWPLPVVDPPYVEEFIEVNLGSGDFGSGKDQPLLPGDPAPAEQPAYTPPQPIQSQISEAKDVETDDRDVNDAPAIKRPAVSQPNAIKIDNDKVVKSNTAPQPVVIQAPPKPKAVLGRTTGGSGNGGNGADTYRPGTGEGIAGGQGDQGRPGGSPTGRNYSGAPRPQGIRVVQIPSASFEDDFNESGKVALDVVVNENGKLVSTSLQPRGTTTSNRKMIDIAKRRAYEISYPKYEGGFKQTIVFDFKVKG